MENKQVLSFVQLNIERNKHLQRFIPLLQREKPDVVCLQEVIESYIPEIEKGIGMKVVRFAPMTIWSDNDVNTGIKMGVAIFSRLEAKDIVVDYYVVNGKKPGEMTFFERGPHQQETIQKVLLSAVFEKDGKEYRIGTTHFTWTPDGEASDTQREDVQAFLKALSKYPEIVFSGDLNAPRGKEIFETIAKEYHDNIPKDLVTSIDQELHRVKGIMLMVDSLFSTPGYEVSNVRTTFGVSDHCAIAADIKNIYQK
jgi:endonuclease/exonuclease/phosphatase family metal-dependent hydrolase